MKLWLRPGSGEPPLRDTLTQTPETDELSSAATPSATGTAPESTGICTQLSTDCDFDPAAWDRGDTQALTASGIGRVVINRLPAVPVQLSPQVEAETPQHRVVIETPDRPDAAMLQTLHGHGVRGVRFAVDDADSLDDALAFADRIVPLGWHIEFNLADFHDTATLARTEWLLMRLPLAICFTGLAGFARARASDDDELEMLRTLVHTGRTWVKLTGADLAATPPSSGNETVSMVQSLMAIREDRLVWGSGASGQTGTTQLRVVTSMQTLAQWFPEASDRTAILSTTPAYLYGF